MTTKEKNIITVETTVLAPVEQVWNSWTQPGHITKWNAANDDWHCPKAENDLRKGGKFSSIMAAKDGSMEFDFSGIYDEVVLNKLIEYTLGDDRKVKIVFESKGNETLVTETFEAEGSNPIEMQQMGWQAILDNFKQYTESLNKMVKMHFEVSINVPVDKVYKIMLDAETYKSWTAEFNPSSYYKGSWDKGSKILFVGVDQDGKEGGMVATIKENIPNEFISIQHLGILDGEKEITSGPEVDGWAGALENYTFKDVGGKTIVEVDVDTNQQFKSYFEDTWPKALNKLKSICEK